MASMRKIKADQRHRGVIVLIQDYQPQRDSAEWSMGFQKIVSSDARKPAYADFVDGPLTGEEFVANPAKSLKLLRNLRKYMH